MCPDRSVCPAEGKKENFRRKKVAVTKKDTRVIGKSHGDL